MVVARRFGLYGSCAKRAFTRSRGVVFSSIDMCVDFKLRRLEVIYVKPGIFRGGGSTEWRRVAVDAVVVG